MMLTNPERKADIHLDGHTQSVMEWTDGGFTIVCDNCPCEIAGPTLSSCIGQVQSYHRERFRILGQKI